MPKMVLDWFKIFWLNHYILDMCQKAQLCRVIVIFGQVQNFLDHLKTILDQQNSDRPNVK